MQTVLLPEDVESRVLDRGFGIPPEDLETIVHRYQRSRSGLGLSIVREIVELRGGTVWAQSRADAGSTLCVRSPLTAP